MEKLLLLCGLFLISCSVKKNKNTKEFEVQQEQQAIIKKEKATEQKSTTETQTLTLEENMSISVEPIGDQPAEFTLHSEGKEIKGTTTGKLTINEQAKKETQETRAENNKTTSEASENKSDTKYIYKDKIVEVEVERKTSLINWLWVIGLSIVVWEVVKWGAKQLFKRYLKVF